MAPDEAERRLLHQKQVARDTEARRALEKVARLMKTGRAGLSQRAGSGLSRLDAVHTQRLSQEAQAQAEVAAFREISDFEAAATSAEEAVQHAGPDTTTRIIFS